ncbi:hypothetical protein Q9L58_001884 [Maublancomyces gigas]|uniref:Uncharacterized protein n=1 Tax=Discina gigas TaxID=1032678 RepID=A0ABR3GT21_9PEZI
MAEAHLTHIQSVIDTLSRHKDKIQDTLDIAVEDFGFPSYLAACSILKRGESIGTIVPNDKVSEDINKDQLKKMIELVDQVVKLESEIKVVNKALKLKVKKFMKTLF